MASSTNIQGIFFYQTDNLIRKFKYIPLVNESISNFKTVVTLVMMGQLFLLLALAATRFHIKPCVFEKDGMTWTDISCGLHSKGNWGLNLSQKSFSKYILGLLAIEGLIFLKSKHPHFHGTYVGTYLRGYLPFFCDCSVICSINQGFLSYFHSFWSIIKRCDF